MYAVGSRYEGDKPYVYLCGYPYDLNMTRALTERLSSDGYRLWYDDGSLSLAERAEAVAGHIEGCRVMIAAITKLTVGEKRWRDEIAHAVVCEKPIIPIFLENVTLSAGLKMQLAVFQYITRRKYDSEDDFYQALYRSEDMPDCLEEKREGLLIGALRLETGASYFTRDREIVLMGNSKEYGLKLADDCFAAPVTGRICYNDGSPTLTELNVRGGCTVLNAAVPAGEALPISDGAVLNMGGRRTVLFFGESAQRLYDRGSADVLYCDNTGEAKCLTGEELKLGRKFVWKNGTLRDPTVSTLHAVIRRQDGGCTVTDVGPAGNGSTNGTYINGLLAQVNEAVFLKNGDRLILGDTELIYYHLTIKKKEVHL